MLARAAQIGMHHVALDRPGPHDRHLDDEIVEVARLQPRQHRHLRAALDLEHADRVGALDHVVDRRVLVLHGRPGSRGRALAVVRAQRSNALRRQVSMPSAEHVDLQQPSVEVVLVPLDDGALLHGGVLDRHHLVEARAGDDEAADMLGEMAREADQLAGERDRLASRGSEGRGRPARLVLRRRPASTSPTACRRARRSCRPERPNALPTSRMALRPR